MKALRLIGLLVLATAAWAAPAPPAATSLLKTAEDRAGLEHKNVLLIFHASWCGWCHKLDDLLNSAAFKSDFDTSYVIVHVTVLEDDKHKADENPGGMDLLASLGGKDGGIPFFAIFDPTGQKLGDSLAPTNIGYPSEPKEVVHFMGLMKSTSKMSEAEQDKLRAFLSKKS
jgi:thioredoxin-related protein